MLGAGHPDIAYSLNNVALCLDGLGQVTEAIDSWRRALPIVENGLGARPSAHRLGPVELQRAPQSRRPIPRGGQAAERALAILEREIRPAVRHLPAGGAGHERARAGGRRRALLGRWSASTTFAPPRSPTPPVAPRRASCWRGRYGSRVRIGHALARSRPRPVTSTCSRPTHPRARGPFRKSRPGLASTRGAAVEIRRRPQPSVRERDRPLLAGSRRCSPAARRPLRSWCWRRARPGRGMPVAFEPQLQIEYTPPPTGRTIHCW